MDDKSQSPFTEWRWSHSILFLYVMNATTSQSPFTEWRWSHSRHQKTARADRESLNHLSLNEGGHSKGRIKAYQASTAVESQSPFTEWRWSLQGWEISQQGGFCLNHLSLNEGGHQGLSIFLCNWGIVSITFHWMKVVTIQLETQEDRWRSLNHLSLNEGGHMKTILTIPPIARKGLNHLSLNEGGHSF